MKGIITHLLPISCQVCRLVKTELLVSEWKAASLSSLRLRPGQQSQPVNSHCSQLLGKKRAGDQAAATASRLTAICVWSSGQTSRLPAESAIFCKSEWKSGFRRRRQLVRLLSLHPLLIQWELWDVGGNPAELKRVPVKTKASVRARAHNHFHTLFYLVKVFAVTLLITWMAGDRTMSVSYKNPQYF